MGAEAADRSTPVHSPLDARADAAHNHPSARGHEKPEGTSDEADLQAIGAWMTAAERERRVTLGSTLGLGGMGVAYTGERVALAGMSPSSV